MSTRLIQLNAQLQQEISLFYQAEAPELFASFTRVETSPDMRDANVWVSFIKDDGRSFSRLNDFKRELQNHLFKRLSIKIIPHIHFKQDEGLEYAEHISNIIQEIKKDKE